MAKSKAELLAEKMAAKRVGQTAFEAGKAPIVETNPPAPQQVAPQEDLPAAKEDTVSQSGLVEKEKPTTKEKKQTNTSSKQVKKATQSKTEEDAKIAPPADVLARVQKKKRAEKKTKVYYLSVENIDLLAKAAEEADTVPSTLLDEILTSIFSSWEK